MKLNPLHDNVVVTRRAAETRAGSLFIPETVAAKDKPQIGEVLAVGPGRLRDDGTVAPMSVKPGDRILFSKYAGSEILIGETSVLVVRDSEILGTLDEAAAPS